MSHDAPESPSQDATDRSAHARQSRRSRRALLLSAAGTAGAALVVPSILAPAAVGAQAMRPAGESATQILSVARTAEQLAVTFYSNGIANHEKLGITGANLSYLKAAVAEEQNHLNFLAANGAQSLAATFSFPHGEDTFEHLPTFIATLEQLETAFVAAYLAAVKEFAEMGQPRLAQIAAQIMGVEAEHRTLGRDIGNLIPADNFAYEPVLLSSVGEAVSVLASEGYLAPKEENSYAYHAVSANYPGVTNTTP